jgi:hypothetical protein
MSRQLPDETGGPAAVALNIDAACRRSFPGNQSGPLHVLAIPVECDDANRSGIVEGELRILDTGLGERLGLPNLRISGYPED